MSALADFAGVTSPTTHPKDWTPFVETSSAKGKGIVQLKSLPPADELEKRLLTEAEIDPEQWRAININHRKWMRYDREWLYYWKFDLVRRVESDEEERQADIAELKKMFRKAPKRKPLTGDNDDAWLIVASDWQVGKGEGGGSAGTIDRWLQAVEAAKAQVKHLRRRGLRMPQGALAGTGDLHEGTCGFYDMQEFQTDLDRREQNKVVRRMIRHAVDELAPLFDDFLCTAVGGNHGENRRAGKAYTTFADNDDVAAFEVVQEVIADRDGYDHVRFQVPYDELDLCVELGGVNVGLAHGHQLQFAGGGKLPQAKALEWWKGQIFGFQRVHQAQILITSHYHHTSVVQHGLRTHLQTPALDGGSRWFKDTSGQDAPPGVMTMRLDSGTLTGWDDLKIL